MARAFVFAAAAALLCAASVEAKKVSHDDSIRRRIFGIAGDVDLVPVGANHTASRFSDHTNL